MVDFVKLKEIQLNRLADFEAACKVYEEDCPVILKLFDSPKMLQYSLLGVHKDNLESMEGIASSLHHAFVDDGALHIKRKISKNKEEVRRMMNRVYTKAYKLDKIDNEIRYDYAIEWGDNPNGRNISADEFSKMIDLDRQHYEYYEKNQDAIENRDGVVAHGIRVFSDENKEYWRLSGLLHTYLESLYKEHMWED